MKLQDIIVLFDKTGTQLKDNMLTPEFEEVIYTARSKNAWFTFDNIKLSIESISEGFLKREKINELINKYPGSYFNQSSPKKVGIMAAGNLPLVGFQDLLHTILVGHSVLYKASSQDDVLINYILGIMNKINPEITNVVNLVEKLNDADAYIATGSGNSSRYFEYYFAKKPHIIRKNRNSVAVIDGTESRTELANLANDIFLYFGLGCRNVSKIFIPENYDLSIFFEAIEYWNTIKLHSKYTNNYDYMKSIYLINRVEHLDNGFVLLKEDGDIASPISVLFYEKYSDINTLNTQLQLSEEQIQVILSKKGAYTFGMSQTPSLCDYADGVDTIKFLAGI